MKRQLMVQESWEKLGFGHWIDGKSETESELWWEEAHRAVWGHLDDLLLQQRACSTMAQEGALGVPVRSHSKSRQTPLPDRYTLWLRNGSSNEVSKRILDDSCSFRFPFPPRSVRVYLQVFLYKTTPPPPWGGEVLVTFVQWVDTVGPCEMLGSHHSICVLCHITGAVCLFGVKVNKCSWIAVCYVDRNCQENVL